MSAENMIVQTNSPITATGTNTRERILADYTGIGIEKVRPNCCQETSQ